MGKNAFLERHLLWELMYLNLLYSKSEILPVELDHFSKIYVDLALHEKQYYTNHLLKLIFCSVIEEINMKPRTK